MKKLKKLLAVGVAVAIGGSCVAFSACGASAENAFIEKAYAATKEASYNSVAMSASAEITQGEQKNSADVAVGIDFDRGALDLSAGIYSDAAGYEYNYAFVRDGYLFSNSEPSDSAVTNFEDFALGVLNTSASPVSRAVAECAVNPQLTEAISMLALADIAEDYGAVTLDEDALNIDFVAAAEGLYNEVNEFVDSLTDETTLYDVYENDVVKNVLDALDMVLTPDELYDEINQIIEDEFFMGGVGVIYIPEPEGQSTLYEYIGEVLNDEEFAKFLVADGTLGEMKLVSLMSIISAESLTARDIKDAYAAVKKLITIEDGVMDLAVDLNTSFTISKCVMSCKFNEDNVITGVAMEFDASLNSQLVIEIGVTLAIEYSEGAAKLADVNNALIGDVTVEEYIGGKRPSADDDNPSGTTEEGIVSGEVNGTVDDDTVETP